MDSCCSYGVNEGVDADKDRAEADDVCEWPKVFWHREVGKRDKEYQRSFSVDWIHVDADVSDVMYSRLMVQLEENNVLRGGEDAERPV